MPIAQLIKRMTPKGWAMAGAAAAATILFLFFLVQLASAPSYTTLMTGIDPAQTGKITAALSAQGIAYELQNNGTALAVSPAQTAQARVALAGAGLLSGQQQPGFSLFDNQQLGQSTFQQQITYQRALEGQLASTIQSINGVSGAVVQLVLPSAQDQLFAANTTPASAAVLLSGSTALDPSAVRGIAQMVSSSVPGLQLNKVTITDGSGQLLWPAAGSDGAGGLGSKQDLQARYDSLMAAQVNAVLAQTLGAGKAEVVVNADLNANQTSTDSLTYAKKGVPLTTQTQKETLQSKGGGSTGGVAGASANIPAYATGSGTGSSRYGNLTTNTAYGVDKTVAHSILAAGAINRQGVSVLLDKSVPAAALPAIRAAVTNAVGLVPKRGDTISIGQFAFAKPTTGAPATVATPITTYAKYGATALGSLLFLLFVTRLLRRREREAFAGQPTWLRELEAPRSIAALEGGRGTVNDATEVSSLRPAVNVAKRQIEDLVERDPERVAQQVRVWMAEET